MPKRKYKNFIQFHFDSRTILYHIVPYLPYCTILYHIVPHCLSVMVFVTTVMVTLFLNPHLVLLIYTAELRLVLLIYTAELRLSCRWLSGPAWPFG